MADITRRDFAKLAGAKLGGLAAGAAAGTAAGLATAVGAEPARASVTGVMGRMADLPRVKGPRAVVVGGGWSGLTIAKYLKANMPEMDVVLIEKRDTFISHPLSNLWLGGLADLEAVTFSFLDAAKNNDYTLLNATVVDVDRERRRIFTEKGHVHYDYLVLAPGIDYDYASIGARDPAEIHALRTRYPAGFVSGSEHVSLKRKIGSFTGGVFAMTIPNGIFRCSASPYERACMIASVFKRKKIKAKVLVIDPRDEPAVKAEGFLAAFEELYGDIIEYMGSTSVSRVDLAGRRIITELDEIAFDDASIYPRVRGARLLETLGLVDPESPQKEALIDPITYQAKGDGRVYVTGDCRPQPFSKSANTARTEGMYVAKLIAGRIRGEEVAWESPRTLCYSVVNADPGKGLAEGIMVETTYRFDAGTGQWAYRTSEAINKRSPELAAKAFDWATTQYRDMF